MRIAVIPARGGSKRIPRKNIKTFRGKPMVAWSIEAAHRAEVFDKVIVSTDDCEIAEVAQEWGAEVPFIRPENLADDHTGTIEVIANAIHWAQSASWMLDAVCCIYATAPFVQSEDLRVGLHELESGNWSYAFSVTDFAAPIFRSFSLSADGGVEMFFPEHFHTRSQDLPIAMHDAGQFYWGKPSAWLEGKGFFEKHSYPVVIPRWRVQDIDTVDDWKRAELMHKAIFEELH